MCYFLFGFLNSGYEAVENCRPFRILERAVLNVAEFTWGSRTKQQVERDCECGEVDCHLRQIIPPPLSYDCGLEEKVIDREPVVNTEIREMFGTVTHTKLDELTTTPYSSSDDSCVCDEEDGSAHLANGELGQCKDYRKKGYTRNNRASKDMSGNDEVFIIDEEKDNMVFTPFDVAAKKTTGGERGGEEAAALCSRYFKRVHESDLECKLQEQKWVSELEEEIKANWKVDPINTTQSSSGREAEPDPVYNTDTPVMSLMNDLTDFKTVLVTLATHLDEAGDDSPSLEEQIERKLSEEFHEEVSSNPAAKQPEEQRDYRKTLESISNDMIVIRTSLDSLQDVLKYYNTG